VRREGGAKLVPSDIAAPPVSILSSMMRRWRTPPAASPATPTAADPEAPRPPRKAA